MQKVKETTDKHLVLVADSDGINTVFLMLVERLKDDRLYGEHLTLLYVSDNYGFVFKEELDILTKRFPTRFLTCYESSHRQETLEAIINSIQVVAQLPDTCAESLKNLHIRILLPIKYRTKNAIFVHIKSCCFHITFFST